MDFRARSHPSWIGFAVHRVSGLLLALFLPLHFWALGSAIQGEVRLDGFLRWAENPLVKAAETVLVVLLAAHLAGGLRVMALEFLGWGRAQKDLVALSFGLSLLVGLVFLFNVF
jgi:fumarate reductase subunit D